MVAKKPSHVTSAHKHVKLKAHHARPYRSRHVGLFLISLVAMVLLGIALVQYRDQLIGGVASGRSFVSDLFAQNKAYEVKVNSSLGFNLTYDQKKYYASAITYDTGDLYIGSELGQQHAYSIVRIAPNFTAGSAAPTTPSALTLTVHPDKAQAENASDAITLQDGGIDAAQVSRVATSLTTLDGQIFKKTTWQSKNANALSSSLSAKFVTYSGFVRGSVVTIVVSLGVGDTDEEAYLPIINSLSFSTKIGAVSMPSVAAVAKAQSSRSVLDMVMGTNIATAASSSTADLTGSEKVAALYSPAVVKIYNAYCMDIAIDGKSYLKNACSAASGSGFFVSQDGYIATNGHVGATSPLDIVIADAIGYYSTKGDPRYFNLLLSLTSLKPSDIPASATNTQKLGMMVDAMYTINPSRFTTSNDVENLLVQVTAKNPDVAALLQSTKDRKTYSNDSVLKAKLIASDYRRSDGYDGFKASDVAIIQVEGSNFPVTKLGSLESVPQGADLSILGYPGNASSNGIVESTLSEATLTTGKVSSKKNAAGSEKRLIETDATIGHGNSGGPALDNNGDVVGIATYTADGSGQGNGVFNYIRDIKDLIDLAADNDITFDTNSETQLAWEKGIGLFYSSRYSKALVSFKEVESLYPNDSRVAEFIAASEKRIANGEDVVDFPLVPVIVLSAVILLGAGVGVLLMMRHHKKHIIYNAGVAQGTVHQVGTGAPAQHVVVSEGPAVGVPLVSTPASLIRPPESIPGVQPVALPQASPEPLPPAVNPLAFPVTPEPAAPPVTPPTPEMPAEVELPPITEPGSPEETPKQ